MNQPFTNLPFAITCMVFGTVATASLLFIFIDGLLYILDDTLSLKIRLLTIPMIAVGIALLHAAYSALLRGWWVWLGIYLVGLIALSILV